MVATLCTVSTYVKRHLGGSHAFNTAYKLGKSYIQHCTQAGEVVHSTLHPSWGKSYIQHCIHLRKLYLQCRKKEGRIKLSKKKMYKEIKLIRQTWKRVTRPIPSLTKSRSSRLHTAVAHICLLSLTTHCSDQWTTQTGRFSHTHK